MSRGIRHRIYVDRSAKHSARREADYLYTWMSRRRFNGKPIQLGGATGRTQIELYRRLIAKAKDHDFDLSRVEIYFLDEYFGAAPLYYAYARQHLRVGSGVFFPDNIHVPRGCFFDRRGSVVNSDRLDAILLETEGEWDELAEPGEQGGRPPEIRIRSGATHPLLKQIRKSNAAYHKRVCRDGKGRMALLGIGPEGHIGFVERGAATRDTQVMLTRLSKSTERANRNDFLLENGDGNKVRLEPARHAMTQGIETILSAGELLMAAHGRGKRRAVRRMLLGGPGPQNPAAFVKEHACVQFYLDVESFGGLRAEALEARGFEVHLPRGRKLSPQR